MSGICSIYKDKPPKETKLFGCGFTSDEKTESFLWLFEKWQDTMSGYPPKIIFTDQESGMTKANSIAFPQAYHRYCMQHMMSKVSSKVGPTIALKPEIMSFYDCVWKAEASDQF